MEAELEGSSEMQGYLQSLAGVIAVHSQLMLHEGEQEQAIEAYHAAKERILQPDLDVLYGPLFLNIEFELNLASANFKKVVSLSEGRIETLRSAGIRLFLPDILRFRGQALAELGRLEQAAAALAEAKEIAEAIGSRRALWPILATWGEMLCTQGNQVRAAALHEEARGVLEYLIEHLSAPDLHASFLEQPLVRRTLEG